MSESAEAVSQEAPVQGQPSEQQTSQSQNQENHSQPVDNQPDPKTTRLINQVNGMKSLVDPLVEGGLNTPDAVAEAIQASRQLADLKSKGINIDAILGGGQQQQEKPESAPLSMKDIESLLDSREARSHHEQANQESTSQLQSFANEVGGENSSLVWKITEGVASEYLRENGELYPVGHPLHESDYKPLKSSDVEAIKSKVKKQLDTLSGMIARNAANQVSDVDSLGSGGGMDGAAGSQNGAGVRDAASRKERIERKIRENLAMLNGETISNA